MKKEKDGFTSNYGFVLACIGSAVGMGNIWLFPYRVSALGGAAFLIPYIICVLLLGYSGVVGEICLGRGMGAGSIGAFSKAFELRGKKYGKYVGLIPTIGSLAIALGYSVVVAWILKFVFGSISGSALVAGNAGQYFTEVTTGHAILPWHLLSLGIVFVVMSFGVSKGIEKINKILTPVFYIMFIFLAVRVAFLPGATQGYAYLLKPNWSAILAPNTWVYALGQAFFSLSLAGSGTVVYGSYMKKDEDVLKSAKYIILFDTLAGMLAAFVIIPTVFAFGVDPMSGPPLMFITLPSIFTNMPMGQIFAIVFFIAVLFAALTSLVNLFETPVEALEKEFNISRKVSVLVMGVLAAVISYFIEDGAIVSTWMDIVSIYIVPMGALLAAITVYWVCGKNFARSEAEIGASKPLGKWFEPMGRYVFVGITIIVYILGIIYGGIG